MKSVGGGGKGGGGGWRGWWKGVLIRKHMKI